MTWLHSACVQNRAKQWVHHESSAHMPRLFHIHGTSSPVIIPTLTRNLQCHEFSIKFASHSSRCIGVVFKARPSCLWKSTEILSPQLLFYNLTMLNIQSHELWKVSLCVLWNYRTEMKQNMWEIEKIRHNKHPYCERWCSFNMFLDF